jgi:phage terminase large subunit-like protein
MISNDPFEAAIERSRTDPKSKLAEMLNGMSREEFAAAFTPKQFARLQWDWSFLARPCVQSGPREYRGQMAPPGNWDTWFLMSGIGFGKTRIGAEWIIGQAMSNPKARLAIVGGTFADAHACMWDGESGIRSRSPPWFTPEYNSSEKCIRWPNGAQCHLYTSEAPEALRGPPHSGAWGDEIAKWRNIRSTYDLLMGRLRIGAHPQLVLTSTPRMAVGLLKEIIDNPTTVVTRGSIYDNADNIAPNYLAQQEHLYRGTDWGRQELLGEYLEQASGALFKRANLNRWRVDKAPDGMRIVIGCDPSGSTRRLRNGHDVAGLVVVGAVGNVAYVLEDASGEEGVVRTPREWAEECVKAYWRWGAERVIVENNHAGELGPELIRKTDERVVCKAVTSVTDKADRAGPISAQCEIGNLRMVGTHALLEQEMCSYVPVIGSRSPGRLDALVFACTELLLGRTTVKYSDFSNQFGSGLSPRRRGI